MEEHGYMRRFVVPLIFLLLLFLFPFQAFIIGNEIGVGMQGAVFRYQVSGYGISLIPIPQEVMYIYYGIYSGKTALSVIIWALGTILLTMTTWYSLVYADGSNPDYNRQISLGLTGSCICYLISCIARYGIFFHASSGTSLPFGIGIILIWLGFFWFFPKDFFNSV
jgi:hypothetical protein